MGGAMPIASFVTGPDHVETRDGTDFDEICSRREVRIIECGSWNITFMKEDVV